MKRIAASLLAIVLVTIPMSVRPLGLGEIDLRSHLNEPLAARVPVHSLGEVETDSIRVTLGTSDQFRQAGIERAFVLNSLRFAMKGEGAGAYIAVTTRRPIAEPFLNFLLEVNWSNGRVVREYTMLLDPPIYGAAITTHVKEVVATVNAPPSTQVSQAPPAPAPQSTSEPTPEAQTPSSISSTAAPAGTTTEPGGTYGPVRSSDTLWSLADRFRGSSNVSIQQMMLAMLRLNPNAFQEGNVNLLREGAVLRIPTQSQSEELARSEALAEVQRQHAAWQDFRRAAGARIAAAPQGVAASSGAPAGMAPKAPAAKATSSADSKAATGAEKSADGELKLVSGGEASGGVGTSSGDSAEISTLRNELDGARDEADASRREAEELAARVEETEAIIQELERLVKLRDADLAALQDQLRDTAASMGEASQPALPVETGTEPKPAMAAPEQAAQAPKKPMPVPLPPATPSATEEPTGVLELVRSALGDIVPFDPILLIGGAILVVVIAVVGIVFSRRRKSEADDVAAPQAVPVEREESESALDVDSTQIMMAGVGRDEAASTVVETPVEEELAEHDTADEGPVEQRPTQSRGAEDDPLAEVNVYLAYERFEQAESLVNDAIDKNPDRTDYKLKLLEIHHAAKNAAAFSAAAALLQATVGDNHSMMDTAREWWGDISPGTELFSGDDGSDDLQTQIGVTIGEDDIFDVTTGDDDPRIPIGAAETTTQLSGGVEMGQGVDFDLGLDFGADDSEEFTGEGTNVDFDLGLGDEGSVGSDTGLDFDVTEAAGNIGGAAAAETDLSFDLEDLVGDDVLSDTGADTGTADTGAGQRGLVLPVDSSMEFEATTLGEDTDLDFALDDGTVATGDAGDEGALDFVLDDPTALSTGPTTDVAAGLSSGAVGDRADGGAETDLEFDLDLDLGMGEDTGPGDDAPVSLADDAALDFVPDDVLAEAPRESGSAGADDQQGIDADLDFDLSDFGDEAQYKEGGLDDSDAIDIGAAESGAGTDLDLDLDLESLAETSEIPSPDSVETSPSDLDFDLEIPGASNEATSVLDFDFDTLGAADEAKDELGTVEMSSAEPGSDTGGLEVPRLEADTTFDFAPDIPEETETNYALADGLIDIPDNDGSETAELDFDVGLGSASDTDGLSIDEDFAGLFGDADAAASIDEPAGEGELTELDLDFALDDGSIIPTDDAVSDFASSTSSEDPGLDLGSLLTSEEDESASNLSDDPFASASDDEATEFNLDDLDIGAPAGAEDSVLDFDLGAFADDSGSDTSDTSGGPDIDFDALELDDDAGGLMEPVDDEHEPVDEEGEAGEDRTLVLGRSPDGVADEIQTKLDLAQAYLDMGDGDGAKGILAEVMSEGNDEQRGQAEGLLKSIG